MTSRSLFHDLNGVLDVAPGNLPVAAFSTGGTNNSTGFDRTLQNATSGKNYTGALLIAQTGAATGTPTAISASYQVQDSPDNSTWADFGSALVLTAASSAGCLSVNLMGADRYVRVVETITLTGGTSPTLLATSVLALIADKSR